MVPHQMDSVFWGERWNSNPHKPESRSGALPLSYSRHILAGRVGVGPTHSGFSDQRLDRLSYLPICMGGNFIERCTAVLPRSTTKGKRRFRAYYLSRISIRLSLNYRCVSNHIDNVITFKLGIFCIPLPWVCPKGGGYY